MCRDGRITDGMSIIAMAWAAMDWMAARRRRCDTGRPVGYRPFRDDVLLLVLRPLV
jgi:hypothetical protein